jgi:hypothetical protein
MSAFRAASANASPIRDRLNLPRDFRTFDHHVRYEIAMLRCTFSDLAVRNIRDCQTNALIESFCIHCRNLIDFFMEKRGPSEGYAAARHFAVAEYQPFPKSVSPTLYGKLSQHVAHITYSRTANDANKINAEDRVELLTLIEDEIRNFREHLKPSYRFFDPGPGIAIVRVLDNATTTTSITVGMAGATGPWR